MVRSLTGLQLALVLACGAPLAAIAESTPLIEAVKRHDRVAVNALLDRGADVAAAEGDGTTALHWAAQIDDLDMIEVLLDAGAAATATNRFNVTPLELASNNGNAAAIEQLLQAGADPNALSREGQTPLMSAALGGNVGAVEALLAHGVEVDAAEAWRGQTALMWAAGEGNVDVARTLIAAGANVTAKSKSGFTPLLFAVRNAQIETMRLLLDHGANANDLAPDDATSALNVAVVNAFLRSSRRCCSTTAPTRTCPMRALRPLHTIAWLRKPGVTGDAGVGELPTSAPRPTGKVDSLELAQKLLDHGANPNVRVDWQEMKFDTVGGVTRNPPGLTLGRHLLTYNGATAFYVAAKNGDAGVHAPSRRERRRSIDHESLRRHAADDRGGARLRGRGKRPGPFTGSVRSGATRRRQARGRARQRRQRERRISATTR